jgi:hypothetical protein
MVDTIKQRPLRLRYHAVTVESGGNACAQARALKGVRLLSLEAPRLPLVGCDRHGDCKCKFLHHSDRRAGPRRGLDTSLAARGQAAHDHDRRRSPGRRDTDFD